MRENPKVREIHKGIARGRELTSNIPLLTWFLGLWPCWDVGNRQALEDEVCAWRLHPNTRNQAKGMLEVLRLAHVNSEFESRVSVRPSNPYPTVAR